MDRGFFRFRALICRIKRGGEGDFVAFGGGNDPHAPDGDRWLLLVLFARLTVVRTEKNAAICALQGGDE